MWDLFTLNRETSDTELDKWGKEHIPGFLGVIPREDYGETYPTVGTGPAVVNGRMRPGTSVVMNLDYGDYSRGGTHWTAARVAKDAPMVLYYDSFGLPAPREVTLRAWRDGRSVSSPDIQSQQWEEVNCGPRALAVLHFLAHAKDELAAWGEIGQMDAEPLAADLGEEA